jgi:hypothetical protein
MWIRRRQCKAVEVAEVGMNVSDIEYERSGIILRLAARLTSHAAEMSWVQGREDQKRTDKLKAQMLTCWTQSADAETLVHWVCLWGNQLAESFRLCLNTAQQTPCSSYLE